VCTHHCRTVQWPRSSNCLHILALLLLLLLLLFADTNKLKKDPNAPKKGLSAFLFFSKSARSRLKEQFPESKPTDISKLLGEEVGSNGHFL
jgi:hypothetical protein